MMLSWGILPLKSDLLVHQFSSSIFFLFFSLFSFSYQCNLKLVLNIILNNLTFSFPFSFLFFFFFFFFMRSGEEIHFAFSYIPNFCCMTLSRLFPFPTGKARGKLINQARTEYNEIPLLRPPIIKTFYLLKSLFWMFKLFFSSFSTTKSDVHWV